MKQNSPFQDTISWYDENAEAYSEKIEKLPYTILIDKFSELLKSGDSILDAGCAGGRDSQDFMKRGFNVVGVDLSSKLIEVSKKKYPEIRFEQANFVDLPFEDNTFDGVWAHASLLHSERIEDLRDSLLEFYRVLRPEGILYTFVKQRGNDKETSVVSDVLSNHDRFFRWFTVNEMVQHVEEAGFEILESQGDYPDLAEGREDLKWVLVIAKKPK